jgi:hypothetical protein
MRQPLRQHRLRIGECMCVRSGFCVHERIRVRSKVCSKVLSKVCSKVCGKSSRADMRLARTGFLCTHHKGLAPQARVTMKLFGLRTTDYTLYYTLY